MTEKLKHTGVVIKEEPADEEIPLDENRPEELNGCSDQECNNLSNTLNILHAERNLENGNRCLPNSQISNGENAIIKDNHHKKLAEKLKHTDVVIKEEPTDEEMPLDENGPEELNGCSTIFNVMIVKNLFLRNKT